MPALCRRAVAPMIALDPTRTLSGTRGYPVQQDQNTQRMTRTSQFPHERRFEQ